MALELAKHNPVYEDIASKFFEVCLFPLLVGLDAHRCLIMAPRSSSVFFGFAWIHNAQHFIFIADAMTFKQGDHETSLWNEQDGMYYDAIDFGNGTSMQLPVRSLVGLIPLYATLVLEPAVINRFPGFKKRMEWFLNNRTEMADRNMANMKGGFVVCDTKFVYTESS